jgi:hypothetical protein
VKIETWCIAKAGATSVDAICQPAIGIGTRVTVREHVYVSLVVGNTFNRIGIDVNRRARYGVEARVSDRRWFLGVLNVAFASAHEPTREARANNSSPCLEEFAP